MKSATQRKPRAYCPSCRRHTDHEIRRGEQRLFTKADAPAYPAEGLMGTEMHKRCLKCGGERTDGMIGGAL